MPKRLVGEAAVTERRAQICKASGYMWGLYDAGQTHWTTEQIWNFSDAWADAVVEQENQERTFLPTLKDALAHWAKTGVIQRSMSEGMNNGA